MTFIAYRGSKCLAFALFLALYIVAPAHADYTYIWTTIPGSGPVFGGSDSEFAGTIILDSDSSSSGTLADVVSAVLTTPGGTYTYDPSTAFDDSQGDFNWNSSQIENMYFGWSSGVNQMSAFEGVGHGPGGVASFEAFTGGGTWTDEDGSWLAAVPEPVTFTPVLLAAVAGLGIRQRRISTSR